MYSINVVLASFVHGQYHKLNSLFICLFGIVEDGKEAANSDAPENNPQYTTVYVGNIAPEVRISLTIV